MFTITAITPTEKLLYPVRVKSNRSADAVRALAQIAGKDKLEDLFYRIAAIGELATEGEVIMVAESTNAYKLTYSPRHAA